VNKTPKTALQLYNNYFSDATISTKVHIRINFNIIFSQNLAKNQHAKLS